MPHLLLRDQEIVNGTNQEKYKHSAIDKVKGSNNAAGCLPILRIQILECNAKLENNAAKR